MTVRDREHAREKHWRATWSQIAYVARYGKQPLSELLCLTREDLSEFAKALAGIVSEENK